MRTIDIENATDKELVEAAQEAAEEQSSGTQEFVDSVSNYFDERGTITDRQREALRDVVRRA